MSIILKIWLGLMLLTGVLIVAHGLELSADSSSDQQILPENIFKEENHLLLYEIQRAPSQMGKSLDSHSITRP